ncbi:hypothetical protein [Ralstonia solanacearum]|uniref:hypothetical protein n=1 Tax=Ralstonia solanacearum TaxID=305 RepID=UPI00168B0443|nr:hypothetical protein [Ralstonia solanacearum]QNT25575.1 hypothetical protein C2I38_26315 [Ralstonia solanacearum]QNT25862.1 hypothetical protein C2I38_027720 [Ralstonia solanacearum]QNT63216.1 hypothetical protein C2L97_26305 [Ralstonia solanacearum]
MESKQHKLTLTWETPNGTRTETVEFPFRPSEEELGLKLAAFFGVDNYRFDETLREIKECIALQRDSSAQA